MGDWIDDLEQTQQTLRGDGENGVLGRIDKYEMIRELGGGGFGTVYLARDTVAGIDRAVKGLPPEVKGSAEELERIRANFALVEKLHHPHIAAALDLHRAESVQYFDESVREKLRVLKGETLLVMEYAPGVTLSRWVRQFPDSRVPLERAIEITRQIASALDYAHSRRVIHRDIKPANVMMETREDDSVVARVLDFGLAAEIRSSMGRVSREVRDTSGTRPYMAPEQWLGERQNAATDQYALAVLFHELVTGRVPFAGLFETSDVLLMERAVTQREPPLPNDLPETVRTALARGLAKTGAERFPSCGEFAAALAGQSVASAPVFKPAVGIAASSSPVSARAACTEEDAVRARVEAKVRKMRIEQIPDEDGFAQRKKALNEVFLKAELFFESRLWADAKCQFAEYLKQCEELEKLGEERKQHEHEVAEVERKRREAETTKTIILNGGTEMRFRWCPPGSFMMGSPISEEGRYDDETQHCVTLTHGFWMGETPVTQKQWQNVKGGMFAGPFYCLGRTVVDLARNALQDDSLYMITGQRQTLREFYGKSQEDDPAVICGDVKDDVPVYYVNWKQAVEFCRRVTAMERAEGRLPDGYEYRLPTEAEWEYACRAATTSSLPNGCDIRIVGQNNAPSLDEIAWYGGNSSVGFNGRGWDTSNWVEKQYPGGLAAPREVKAKKANAWGLYDMLGNVWEWCTDWYGDYPRGNLTDPMGISSGTQRITRGGCWISGPRYCRPACRAGSEPGYRNRNLGFRVALAPCH
ncbi:MAG: SUMF1/EgtB/PvdO family nonheme iron enzyme [Kiritimatiellae bacterium]|nr:SUMF1/EgtB/PvdO family nonheme iron enzyme [Kiritimatiellia bacterium]